jgi:hypothetical protein
MLLLCRAAMAGGANLQLAHNLTFYATDQELRHQ